MQSRVYVFTTFFPREEVFDFMTGDQPLIWKLVDEAWARFFAQDYLKASILNDKGSFESEVEWTTLGIIVKLFQPAPELESEDK